MSYELTGRIIEIFPTQEVSATFKKREFVLEKSEISNDKTFTDTIKFQVLQDRSSLLDNYKIGDEVKVTFNIKGTKWEKEGRVNYFVNLDVWRIEKTGENTTPTTTAQPAETTTVQEEDDLPF